VGELRTPPKLALRNFRSQRDTIATTPTVAGHPIWDADYLLAVTAMSGPPGGVVLAKRALVLGDEDDLSHTTLFCGCMRFSSAGERHGPVDRDGKPAVPNRFGVT